MEPEPGDMIKNRDLVYDKAEEMAAKYREQLLAKQQGITLPAEGAEDLIEEEIPPATEDAVAEEEIVAVEEIPAAIEE